MSAPMKRPQTAYFLYLNANRADIVKELGSADPKKVSVKASEMWKNLPADKKQLFEAQAAKAKAKFDAYKQTDEGKAALAEQKGERQEKQQAKVKREMKAAAKGVEKDEKLKKPTSAYWLWLSDNREKLMDELKKRGQKCDGPSVGKLAGDKWKSLSAGEKAPYEAKAKAQKEEYDAYVKSEEGQAALKAHKDAVAEAKNAVKGAPPSQEKKKRKADQGTAADAKDAEAAAKEPSPKKARGTSRPAKAKTEDSPKTKGKGKPKAVSASTPQTSDLDPSILSEADTLGLKSALVNLASRKEISEKDLKGQQLLSALKESNGLVNKAKAILLAGA